MSRYVLVYEHEYGLDCYQFEFEPCVDRPFPSKRALAEHFGLNFEPAKGERIAAVTINNPNECPQYTAEQIGIRSTCDSTSQ